MDILEYLLPENDSPAALRKFRLRVAGVACYSALIITFFVFPSLLGIPYSVPKLGTVAWSQDLETAIEGRKQAVENQLKDMNRSLEALMNETRDTRAQLLDKDIMESQKNWCDANERHERATAWAQRIRDLMGQYRRLTGKQFELPSCDRV